MRTFISALLILSLHCSWAQQTIKLTGKFRLLTISQDTTEIDMSSYYGLVLFSSNNGCSKCYENIDAFLTNTPPLDSLPLLSIIKMSNCLNCRREFIKQYEVFDQCDRIFFDLNGEPPDSAANIWNTFNIGRSPALGLVKDNTLYLFTYDYLFNGLSISNQLKSAILKLLN